MYRVSVYTPAGPWQEHVSGWWFKDIFSAVNAAKALFSKGENQVTVDGFFENSETRLWVNGVFTPAGRNHMEVQHGTVRNAG